MAIRAKMPYVNHVTRKAASVLKELTSREKASVIIRIGIE